MKRVGCFILLLGGALGLPVAAEQLSWPAVTREMKPWVYNWWMGSAVDAAGLETQCRELAEKGFGGCRQVAAAEIGPARSRDDKTNIVECAVNIRYNE